MRNTRLGFGKLRILSSLIALIMLGWGAVGVHAQDAATLTIGTLEPVVSDGFILDPAAGDDFATWELQSHLFTGLTRQKPGTLEYELALASDHQVSADGLTHTFTIRPDAAFSDGTPITAQVFARSITRMLTLSGPASAVMRPMVSSATVTDSGQLALTLRAPVPYILQLVALPPFAPVHPNIFADDALNPTPSTLIADGSYRLAASQGTELTLEADLAWKGDPPAVSRLIVRHFDLPADLRDALISGTVDVAWRGLPAQDVEIAARSQGIRILRKPSLQAFYLLMNPDSELLSDQKGRAALALLFDRERAVRIGYRDAAQALDTLLPEEVVPSDARYPAFDLAAAEKALTGAGYSRFKILTSELQTARRLYGDPYASAVASLTDVLARLESARIARSDLVSDLFLDQVSRGAFQMALIGLTPLVPHPDAYLRPLFAGATGYANDPIVTLLDQAAMRNDIADQELLYGQIEQIALHDLTVIPLWRANHAALYGKRIMPDSVQIAPNGLLRYDRLQLR